MGAVMRYRKRDSGGPADDRQDDLARGSLQPAMLARRDCFKTAAHPRRPQRCESHDQRRRMVVVSSTRWKLAPLIRSNMGRESAHQLI